MLKQNRFFITSSEVGALSGIKLIAAIVAGIPFALYGLVLVSTKFKLVAKDTDFDGPTILFSWHQNTFLTLVLARRARFCRGAIGLTNDRLASLIVTLSATLFGYRMFIYTLRNKKNRVEQVTQCFNFGNPLIIMADGGGPFFKLKPGLIKTALESKAKLVPVAFRIEKGLELGKVRKHRWPLPFSGIHCLIGQPVHCDFLDPEAALRICQQELEAIETKLNSPAALPG